MILADGYFDWSVRDPGPSFKTYSQQNTGEFIFCHSLEASVSPAYSAVHDVNRQASWTGTLCRDGRLLQHYPVTASVWASGNRESNTRGAAFELEGFAREAMTREQLRTGLRLVAEIGAYRSREYHRPLFAVPKFEPLIQTPAGIGYLLEHNEVSQWVTPNAGPTACPSHRWDPLFDALEDDMTEAEVRAIAKEEAEKAVANLNDAITKRNKAIRVALDPDVIPGG